MQSTPASAPDPTQARDFPAGHFAPRPRKPLVAVVLAAIAGIVVADRWVMPLPWLAGIAAVPALLLLAFRNAWLLRLLISVAFCAMHTARHHHGITQTLARAVADAPGIVDAEGVVWSEPDAFTTSRGEKRATFEMKFSRIEIAGRTHGAGRCLVRWIGPAPAYGDVVKVRGSATPLETPRNPGEFDTAAWMKRKGVAFELHADIAAACEVTGTGQGNALQYFAGIAREWIKSRLAGGTATPDESALIVSMVLGLRGETPPEMKELFQKTGTLHLFAVSGLNVAMLATIAWYLLKALGFSRAAAFFVILPLLCTYAVITGLSPSCVRATVMAAMFLASPLVGRPAVALNSLAAAALAILLWDTNELFSPGFQLSFVLVIVILWLAHPIAKRMEPWLEPDSFIPRELWDIGEKIRVWVWGIFCQTTGVTVAAWLGSLVFMAGYFHLISPVALVANAVAVPLAFCVLALGLMALVVSFSAPLLALVNSANALCAKVLLAAIALFAKVPGGHVYVEWPEWRSAPACELTLLDVGEGAAAHLRAGRSDWLLDCGHTRFYERTLLPYLRTRGINRLDGILLTHGDSAHLGAALPLLDDFLPRIVGDSPFSDRSPSRRGLHAALAERNLGRSLLVRGDVFEIGESVRLRVLYPPSGIQRSTADDLAIVCRIETGSVRILLMSDAGFSTEQWLLKNEPDPAADVIVKGWHGRDFSGTTDFIARVGPRIVVCAQTPFGKTREQFEAWAAPVRSRGIVVLPQHDGGAVTIRIAPDGAVGLQTFLNRAR